MPRQKQSNPKALKQQREEVKLLLKDGQSSTTQESGTEKHSPSGSKGKSNSRRDTGEKKSKYKNAMKVKIAEKVKNKRMARALREKKSSDRKVSQLQDKGNNNMLITTKEPDINEKIIEKFSEPAKKDKYDLIKERSARTTKQVQPKENSPKKIKPFGQQKIGMLQKGNQGVPQDTGQHIDKEASDEDKPVDNPQKDIEQEAADKQQALEALLHISGVELDSFTQEQKEPKLPESEVNSIENQSLPSVKEQSISNPSGQETTASSEAHNMVRIDETEIGVKYQLKSDSLEEQGLKLTYTAPTAADFDLNPVSYGVYRPNRSKPVISQQQQDTEYVDFDKDKGKGIGKHVCEFCGRRCLKPSVLKKHIRSHTGERPYPCIPCGFSFKTKSNLYKHRKSHAHAIKAGITPNFEGIKVIDDYENDSEETESEDEMEIDEGFDTVNNLEIEERLKGIETTGKDEEAQHFGRVSKPGLPGQMSMFSGDGLTPATSGRYLHRFRKESSSSSETRLIQDGNNVTIGGTIPNSINESDGVLTKSIISHTSLSQAINKGSKVDSDTLLREQSPQADTGCGKVLENLRSKDVAGFRIDMETGRAMPILHTQQTEGVVENHEMKLDEKKTKNDTDPAKLMIPLTNFSIVKSGGQFHVQIPVQGILESAIVKESENLLTTQADKSKTVDLSQEKLESIDFKRKNRRTVSETLVSDSVQKSHLPGLPVEDLLKLSRSNQTSLTVESPKKLDQLQQQSSKYENMLLKKGTADATHKEQVTPISVVSSQTAPPLSNFPNSLLGSNKMMWPQSKNKLTSPRKTSTSTPLVHFSPSITEMQNSRQEIEDLQKKSPYTVHPVVTVSHDKPSVGLMAEKYAFLPQPAIPPVSQQNPTHSPNYSRYKTLEETQAALRAAQPKLFKRRKYKSESDTMPSDLNLPKKRGRKLKHERTVVDRVPTPTRPMAPVPFLPTLPPVPQSPLTISTAGIPRTTPMLSSLHFANLPSLDADRHSMISPSGSVIHIPNNIGITSSGSRTRNTNQIISPAQFAGTSTSVHLNTTTVPFSLMQNVPYSSTVQSTSLDSRKHGAASKVQDFVNEHKNRLESHAYHPISLAVQSPFPGPPGPSTAWTKRHMSSSPKTKDYERPRPLMPISDVTHEVSIGDSADNQSRIKMESSVSSDQKQPLARPGFLKTPESFSQIRPSSKPSRKNLTLDIPSFGSLKQPAVTKAGKCTTPIEFAAKTLLSPEAFSIAQSVVKLASPMKTKPDGTPTTPVEAARELGRLAAHAAFANAGGKVENILSPMIPSIATSQGSIVVGPITTPTTSGPQKQFFVLPSPSKGHIPGFPSQFDNQLMKKQVPLITTVETLSVGTPVNVETPVQAAPKPSSAYPPNPPSTQMMSPKLRSQPIPPLSSAVIQQAEFTPLINKPIQNHSTHGQTIEFIHGLPTYQSKPRLRTSAIDKINETVITNEGFKTYSTPLKYLYKNANGSHGITTPMFTCLYRTQPMYVKQRSNNKVSMYSNWRSGCNSLHPLGISWKAHLGLNDSSRNHRPRMIYMVSSLSKDQGGILTHSSMWRREDPRTLANQKNIPTMKQQHQSNSSSRGEINANFPHKLFRHGRTHHRRTESESAVIDCKSKERKMKDLGKHEPLRVPIFEGGFKSNEEYVYVRGRGRGKYVCEECGIRCKKPSMLKKHIRTHTDMRPYKCSICNFAFKTKGNLTKHMKSKAHNKKTVSTGDDADPGSLEDEDDKDDYDNDHQFSDADENEDTDSAEGETSDDDEDDDDDVDTRFPDHSLLRRKRSHGSLPDISGFAGSSSDYHFSSVDAGSLPSLHSTRADQSLSDSLDNISAKRTLKRAHSESLDKVRREKSDNLSSHFPHMNCLGDSGKTEERKPTRSEVVGKLTQHLTNKNLEKLRAQTQSQPLITSLNNDNTKSFDISQLPLPQTGPGILPIPTFQPTYGLTVMNIISGFATLGDSIPMSSNYRISARIHEASKPENNNTDKEEKSEKKQDVVRENTALASHTTNSRESTESKTHSDTTLTTMPTEKISGVGSVFIPVSSVLQCGLIPPTTAPYSSGQFVFTFPMPSPGVTESDVVLPIHHPRVQNVPTTPSGKPIDDFSRQERISVSQENNEKTHGFHKMPFSAIVSKRKRIEAHDRVPTVLTQLEHTPADETFKRIKSSEINWELQQNTRIGLPKSYQCVQAPQAQFMPPSLPVVQSDVSLITSHHSPVLSSPYISGISSIPLVSPMTPSRMSQLPSTILATPEINKTGIQQQSETFIQKDKSMAPTSSSASVSTESSKLSDSIHRRVIDIDQSDVDGIPSPTATRGGFHKCNVCLKDFTKPSQLRIHMRTHADEHPYSCEECSLSFRTRGLLQKHERSPVHFSHVDAVELSTENADDPRPFKCKECSIAFRIPGHLAKHLRSKGHIMAMERQGKLARHRQDLGIIDGLQSKDDGDHEDENTDSASEGETEKVVVEQVKQVEYIHQADQSD